MIRWLCAARSRGRRCRALPGHRQELADENDPYDDGVCYPRRAVRWRCRLHSQFLAVADRDRVAVRRTGANCRCQTRVRRVAVLRRVVNFSLCAITTKFRDWAPTIRGTEFM